MGEWIVAATALAACLGLMPLAVKAMRGRRRRPGGALGNGLLEMQAFIAPSTAHLIAAREDKVVEVVSDSDPEARQEPAEARRLKDRAASGLRSL